MFEEKTLTRFWAKVQLGDGCWEWTGARDRQGYGYFGLKKKIFKAHRISWIIHHGEITNGLQVLHTCDNPSCINPGHLWIGTNLQNVQDKMRKGRHSSGDPLLFSGENHGRSKLTSSQVLEIRKLCASGDFTYKSLGEKFGVHLASVAAIVTGKLWRTVGGLK